MQKLTINPDSKLRFNVEIDLSIQQLKYLCEMSGDEEYNYLNAYFDLSSDVETKALTLDPSFAMGLGADINDILSTGFLVESMINKETFKTKLDYDNLCFHPFTCKMVVIKSIETELVDCEVNSYAKPITKALDSNGNIIDLEKI
jgi:hypothetical protein